MTLGNPERAVGGLAVRTPPGVELRPLGRDDFEVALDFARDLYGLAAGESEPHRPGFEALVNDPDASPFLALADGEPAGLAIFRFRRRLNFATWEGWLSDLFVDPGHRRRGIGHALVEAVVAEWRLRQGHRIMLEVDRGNTAAEALYTATGFSDFGPHFQLRPVPAASPAEPPPGVVIRSLEDDDVEAVTRLIAEFGQQRSPVPERLDAVHRTFRAVIARDDVAGWLATADGAPAGVVVVELRAPFFLRSPVAWVPDLVVTEPARGRGIGAALLNAALTEARSREASAMVLESGTQRAAAHRLYLRCGFAEIGRARVLLREAPAR